MSDPADKSDDLIAELAKLMAASSSSNPPAVAPTPTPDAAARAPVAPPVRIPGMDQARPAEPTASRAPVTGTIRIPGMDSPAPVATSAPVSKFDFGKPVAATAPSRQEPLSSLSERLAPHDPAQPVARATPAPQPAPVRVPSDLKPVSENRSFVAGPSIPVAPPNPAPAAPESGTPVATGGDFHFDFGFSQTPPASEPKAPPANDPIADLIAAEMDEADAGDDNEQPEASPPEREEKPAPVAPVIKTQVTPQGPPKPVFSAVSAAPSRPAGSTAIPLKPVSVAPRAPETDRFAISPGVGLNMKPPPSQPLSAAAPPKIDLPDESDPMSEIESLIGEAVRVELSAPGPVKVQAAQEKIEPHVELDPPDDGDGADADAPHRPEPAPVVPPLTTQFAPRRSGLKDDAGSNGAEEAILAAAAATGSPVDRIDPPVGDESPYRRLKVKPARAGFAAGGVRQYVGMAVAGTLLLAAGLGLYWVLNMGGGSTLTGVDAPQLTADATPIKEIPSIEPAAEAARSPVLEQIDGTSAAPSVEQLVSTDETNGAPVAREVTPVSTAETEGGLANRKVRTVTVRPDGTIVSGDDAVAGTEELPVDRPNVPAVPATDTPNLLGEPTAVAMTDPVESSTTLSLGETPDGDAAGIQPVFNPNIVAPVPLSFPARDTSATAFAPQPAATAEITGAQTPNGQIDLLGGTVPVAAPTQVAAVTPAAAGTAAAYVQLSSSPTEGDAQSSLRAMNSRYGSLFGGNSLVIQAADLGQKGTWYRVRLPVSSLGDGQRICSDIKANGGDCIVSGS